MAIGYENYRRFSKGQGFVGEACHIPGKGGGGHQATSKRWFAVDCWPCRRTLIGKRIVSREGRVATVVSVEATGVAIDEGGVLTWLELDEEWTLFPSVAEIFGEVESND